MKLEYQKPEYQQFIKIVLDYHAEHGRNHLPWRVNQSPYYVAVSEIMLQQTQVDRVIPFFETWMEELPTWQALADAPQSDVLRLWKGLGYNSRALRLQKLAQTVTNELDGVLPSDFKELCKLQGIGKYTAGAIRAFVFNEYTPLIETNVRRVYIHHFFTGQADITDTQILEIIEDIGEIDNPRQWYSAIMDYGSTLPKIIKTNPNRRSKHYSKQSKFEGSDRQIRGKVLDVLLNADKHSMPQQQLFTLIAESLHKGVVDTERYLKIMQDLQNENFVTVVNEVVVLVD